jgi:hypothetical protein
MGDFADVHSIPLGFFRVHRIQYKTNFVTYHELDPKSIIDIQVTFDA